MCIVSKQYCNYFGDAETDIFTLTHPILKPRYTRVKLSDHFTYELFEVKTNQRAFTCSRTRANLQNTCERNGTQQVLKM